MFFFSLALFPLTSSSVGKRRKRKRKHVNRISEGGTKNKLNALVDLEQVKCEGTDKKTKFLSEEATLNQTLREPRCCR